MDWWCCRTDYPNHEPTCPNFKCLHVPQFRDPQFRRLVCACGKVYVTQEAIDCGTASEEIAKQIRSLERTEGRGNDVEGLPEDERGDAMLGVQRAAE